MNRSDRDDRKGLAMGQGQAGRVSGLWLLAGWAVSRNHSAATSSPLLPCRGVQHGATSVRSASGGLGVRAPVSLPTVAGAGSGVACC